MKSKKFPSSAGSAYRTTKKLRVKWYKKKKSQKLNDYDKSKRVKCAKLLRHKLGVRKNSKKYKWNRVVNSDFSGLFALQGFHNQRNNGVWGDEGEPIETNVIHRRTEKFPRETIF